MVTTKNQRPAYTLIELLIVIAIISVLIGVLVPSITRSLTNNRLASDVDVLRAKIEETRLLAGSTQTNDEQVGTSIAGVDRAGYYGVYFPNQSTVSDSRNYNHHPFYALVRLSKPFSHNEDGYCSPDTMITNALQGSGPCLVERIDLASDVSYLGATIQRQRMIAFAVPSQQLVELYQPTGAGNCTVANGYCWQENTSGPVFNQTNGSTYFTLSYRNKIASINIEPYTGKLKVQYSNDAPSSD